MAQDHLIYQNIARAVSAYADQAYTDAVRLAGTALVGSDARIQINDEDFYGTIRWNKTLGPLQYDGDSDTTGAATVINTGVNSEDGTEEGKVTGHSTDFAEYIKSIRSHGADQYNVTQLITQRDGAIAKVAQDFATTRARDADAALVSMLKGVVKAEVAVSEASSDADDKRGQFDPDSLNEGAGFYYDVNGVSGDNSVAGTAGLIDTAMAGGKAATNLWTAMASGFSDLEPDFMYLVVQPSVYQDMRTANLLDEQDRVTDGNVQFSTLMGGLFRVIVSRTSLGNYSQAGTQGADQPVNEGSIKTSLLALPGMISFVDIPQVNPVAIDSDESVAGGFGNREAWYRWGYAGHPRGYTWGGSKSTWATNATFEADGSFLRKENVGNLGLLPIFHS